MSLEHTQPEPKVEVPAFVKNFPQKLPGAAKVDVVVNPPNAAVCIAHIRQEHLPPSRQQLTQAQMLRKSGAVGNFGEHGTWEDFQGAQTGVHAILSHLSGKMNIRATAAEGVADKDIAGKILADVHRMQKRERTLFAEITVMQPLAEIGELQDKIESLKVDLDEGNVTGEKRRKFEQELAQLKKEYEAKLPTVTALLPTVKKDAQAYVELLEARVRAGDTSAKSDVESAKGIVAALNGTPLKELPEKLSGFTRLARLQMKDFKERADAFVAELDTGFLAAGDFLKRGKMAILPSEDKALNLQTQDAFAARNIKLYKELQGKREDMAVKLAAESGEPVVPLIYGGVHDFRRAVEAHNKDPKNAAKQIALIVITPQGYKE